MIVAAANVEAQLCFGKLLLDQFNKSFGLANADD